MINENNQLKEEILGSISELFLKYGLRSTSMDDICTHLKISKKTLYQLFENKDDVVEQVMRYRQEKRTKEMNIDEIMEENPVHFLYGIKHHITNDLGSRLPANLYDMKKYHPGVEKRIVEEDWRFIYNLLSKVISKGIKDSYFKKELDTELQIYLFGKQMSFLGDPEVIDRIEYPIPRVISTIVDNFILAISSEKGIKEFQKIKEGKEKQQQENKQN